MRLATPDDYAQIETICNDPSVRPVPEWPPFVAAQRLRNGSFAVVGEEGCFLAIVVEPSRYMVHTSIWPAYRGERAIAASKEALKVAFAETDALELETFTPSTFPQARLFARQMGFRYRFTRANAFPSGGELHSVGFFSMTILDWALSGACTRAGEDFHARLHGELGAPAHPADGAHDAIVGSTVAMVHAGRSDKAVAFYNYWARVSGYRQISIVSRDPLRIDIHQCVLRVEGPEFFMEASHA